MGEFAKWLSLWPLGNVVMAWRLTKGYWIFWKS